jgi:hypothetical protein
MRRFAIGFCVCLLVGALSGCFILEELDAGPPDECVKEYYRGNRIDNIHLTHEQSRAHDERCRRESQKKAPSKQGENASVRSEHPGQIRDVPGQAINMKSVSS